MCVCVCVCLCVCVCVCVCMCLCVCERERQTDRQTQTNRDRQNACMNTFGCTTCFFKSMIYRPHFPCCSSDFYEAHSGAGHLPFHFNFGLFLQKTQRVSVPDSRNMAAGGRPLLWDCETGGTWGAWQYRGWWPC